MLNELEMEATNVIYADGYVYVVLTNKDNDSNSGRSIYALDLRNNEYSHVIDSRVFDVFVGEDLKTVYISLYNDTNGNQQDTLVALKGKIVGKSRKTYYTVEYNGTEYGKTERRSLDLCVFKDDRYTKTDFKTDEYYAIEQGLLFVKDAPDIVSVYNADTKVLSPVFTTDDTYVTAAINRHGEYLYVSFMRQYIADSGFYSTFENDDISGTYRININTFESTKISDYVFDSLFIFDDSGIFAISDSYLYKLAFDGESLEEYGKLD